MWRTDIVAGVHGLTLRGSRGGVGRWASRHDRSGEDSNGGRRRRPDAGDIMKRLVAVVVLAVITLTSAPALADAGTLISCLPQFSAYTPAFITSPTSDSVVNSTQLISLAGYAPAAGTTVNILARNWTSPPSFSQDQIGSFDSTVHQPSQHAKRYPVLLALRRNGWWRFGPGKSRPKPPCTDLGTLAAASGSIATRSESSDRAKAGRLGRKPWRRGRSWMREPNSWSLPRRTLPNTEEEASSGAAAALAPIPTKSGKYWVPPIPSAGHELLSTRAHRPRPDSAEPRRELGTPGTESPGARHGPLRRDPGVGDLQ